MNDRAEIAKTDIFAIVAAAFAYAATLIPAAFGMQIPAIPWRALIRAAVSAILFISIRKSKASRLLAPRETTPLALMLFVLFGIIAQLAASSIHALACGANEIGVRAAPTDALSWATLASAVIVTPIFEELLFRGVMLSLFSRISSVFAAVATSLAFALIHAGTAARCAALVCGFILALTVIRKGSLLPAIAFHAAFNLASFFAGYLPLSPAVGASVFTPIFLGLIFTLLNPLSKGRKNETL